MIHSSILGAATPPNWNQTAKSADQILLPAGRDSEKVPACHGPSPLLIFANCNSIAGEDSKTNDHSLSILLHFFSFLSPPPPSFSNMASCFTRNMLATRFLSTPRQRVAICHRHIHSSPSRAAVAHPITAHGPPPQAPAPASSSSSETRDSLSSTGDGQGVSQVKKPSPLKKRFWKDVHVHGKTGVFRFFPF